MVGNNYTTIQKFTSDGMLIRRWNTLEYPAQIAVDRQGIVYVAIYYVNQCIAKYTSEGAYLGRFGSSGSGNGQFDTTRGLAPDGVQSIYVADMRNYRIQRFTTGGGFVTTWGSQGRGPGQFIDPVDIAVYAGTRVLVLDSGNHRVQRFDYAVAAASPAWSSVKSLFRDGRERKVPKGGAPDR